MTATYPKPEQWVAFLQREVARLRVELDDALQQAIEWRERYEDERRDHEATIVHCERIMRDNDPGTP